MTILHKISIIFNISFFFLICVIIKAFIVLRLLIKLTIETHLLLIKTLGIDMLRSISVGVLWCARFFVAQSITQHVQWLHLKLLIFRFPISLIFLRTLVTYVYLWLHAGTFALFLIEFVSDLWYWKIFWCLLCKILLRQRIWKIWMFFLLRLLLFVFRYIYFDFRQELPVDNFRRLWVKVLLH